MKQVEVFKSKPLKSFRTLSRLSFIKLYITQQVADSFCHMTKNKNNNNKVTFFDMKFSITKKLPETSCFGFQAMFFIRSSGKFGIFILFWEQVTFCHKQWLVQMYSRSIRTLAVPSWSRRVCSLYVIGCCNLPHGWLNQPKASNYGHW